VIGYVHARIYTTFRCHCHSPCLIAAGSSLAAGEARTRKV